MFFLYKLLNLFFFVFHSFLIFFNLFGWIWRKTRRVNLLIILLTFSSWFILGLWYGYGYCPFTDWHWQVREKLGYLDHPPSYTAFLIREITGWELNDQIVNFLTLALLILALMASMTFNIKDFLQKRRSLGDRKKGS